METALIIIAIVSLLLAGVMSAFLLYYQFQIRHLARKAKIISEIETNQEMTTDSTDRSLNDLCLAINKIIEKEKNARKKEYLLNQLFRESITNISHDIRTPITSARGYVQLLGKDELPSEKRSAYLPIVEGRILSVHNLLTQLFEYSRIESGDYLIATERVNLCAAARNTISLFYNDFEEQGIKPEIEIPDQPYYIAGDAEALTRIFQNVINNALVHGEKRFSMSVNKSGQTYSVSISNLADSMQKDDLEHIFDRLFTADRSRTQKTTGLGLSIAKRLTEMMGGQIESSYVEGVFQIKIVFPILKE
jgi:signal transduction histidine kinase